MAGRAHLPSRGTLPEPPPFAGDEDGLVPVPLLTMDPSGEGSARPELRREVPVYSRSAPRSASGSSARHVTVEIARAPAEALPPAETVAGLVEQAVDALLRRDHRAALEAYQRALALAPDNRTIGANVERLHSLLHARAADGAKD